MGTPSSLLAYFTDQLSCPFKQLGLLLSTPEASSELCSQRPSSIQLCTGCVWALSAVVCPLNDGLRPGWMARPRVFTKYTWTDLSWIALLPPILANSTARTCPLLCTGPVLIPGEAVTAARSPQGSGQWTRRCDNHWTKVAKPSPNLFPWENQVLHGKFFEVSSFTLNLTSNLCTTLHHIHVYT